MPTLHGFSYSNYYNIPKHALLYKGVVFSEDLVYASAEGYNKLSPALKVPSLTTDSGHHLSEAAVLCEYIEEAYPQRPLFPADVFARNKNRQLMHMAELYLELPNRRLIPFSLSKQPAPEQLIAEVVAVVERGINCINALATFKPWLFGAQFTMADIYLYYVLTVAEMGGQITGVDLNQRIAGLEEWRSAFAADPISQRVAADKEANREGFFSYIKSRS
ncbi:glutathione S-transferase family protein [Sneathiella marina]|uniref:Glutathione S-transferase family protein n=1 Tax=Sneathiella marina TaxID=2950108 RepID=A0ABY4W225_9PROT|nr:glutathione S-transferase family protein [Sneathiella marina]USG61235.1 glutathione S-transferase family protein [Sneathiella marina]